MDTNTKFSMSDADHANWLALKVSVLSIAQQQRTLKRLARDAMVKTAGQNTKSTALVDKYTWHRRVRLSREARLQHLIRAYLKGVPYEKVEHKLVANSLDVMRLMFLIGSDPILSITNEQSAFLTWAGYGVNDILGF
jgi:hypothetical protein